MLVLTLLICNSDPEGKFCMSLRLGFCGGQVGAMSLLVFMYFDILTKTVDHFIFIFHNTHENCACECTSMRVCPT